MFGINDREISIYVVGGMKTIGYWGGWWLKNFNTKDYQEYNFEINLIENFKKEIVKSIMLIELW